MPGKGGVGFEGVNALDAGEMPVPTPSDTSPESMLTASLDSSTSPRPRLWNTMLVGFASTCEAVDGGDGSDDGRGGECVVRVKSEGQPKHG